jgi:PDZ domain
MKYSIVAIVLAAAMALSQPAPLQAAEIPAAASQSQAVKGYLGVTIDRLPDSVRAQLPATIPPEQGILVEQVMQGSPAEKAGLQPFDILLQYNDQKLFSPEQLTRLVRSSGSGQTAQLTIVRGGSISTLQVTLGESQPQQAAQQMPQHEFQSMPFPGHHRHPFSGPGQKSLQATEGNWESFDSLSLEKLQGDQYKAVIGYLADDGTHKRREFQGTREEIRQQIMAQEDLPDAERDQLLEALTARDNLFPFRYPPMMPFEQGFLAPPPWWGWHPDF